MMHLYLAGGLLLALLSAGGYAVHVLREADRNEIEALQNVAEHNRTEHARERRRAALSAALADEAAKEQAAARDVLEGRLAALRSASDETPADGECPAACRLRWQPAEDNLQN